MHILGYSVNGYFNIGAVLSMKAIKTGLSKKLLTRVLSVYFILTVIVTVGQIFTEYLSTKNHVEGELQTRKWQDQDGNDRYTTEVILQGYNCNLTLLDSRNNTNQSSEITQEPSIADENLESQTSDSEDPEEDIPF